MAEEKNYIFVPNLKCDDVNISKLIYKDGETHYPQQLKIETEPFVQRDSKGYTKTYNGYVWKVGSDFYLPGIFGDNTSVGGISKEIYSKQTSSDGRLRVSLYSLVSTLAPYKQDNYPFNNNNHLEYVYLQNLGYIFYNRSISNSSYKYPLICNNVTENKYAVCGSTGYYLDYAGLLINGDYSTMVKRFDSNQHTVNTTIYEYPFDYEYTGINKDDYYIKEFNPETEEFTEIDNNNWSFSKLNYNSLKLTYNLSQNNTTDWKYKFLVIFKRDAVNYGGDSWYDRAEAMLIIVQEPSNNLFEFIYSYPNQEWRDIDLEKYYGDDIKFPLAQVNYFRKAHSTTIIRTKNLVYVPTTCKIYYENSEQIPTRLTNEDLQVSGYLAYNVGNNFVNLEIRYDT